MGIFSPKRSKEQLFWEWFTGKASKYRHVEGNEQALYKELATQLATIDANLTFEFSPVFDDGTRKLIISADGIKASFPAVTNLITTAPAIDNWRFIAFRQPYLTHSELQYDQLTLSFSDVFFRYAKDNGRLGLELNIRGYEDTPQWGGITFLLLDCVIGEYATEMSISWIDRRKLTEEELPKLLPITDLPEILKQYQREQ